MGYIAQGFDLDTQFRSYDAGTTNLTNWRGVQSIQFSADMTTTGVAPFAYVPRVFPRGWGVDRPAEKLRIRHTFGDPGSTFRANRATEIWGAGADVDYGDCPGHTYAPTAADFDAATPDGDPPATELSYTHTVELERADGETSTTTRTITVLNPDHVFQGAATVIVDPDGDFTGAPVDPYGGTYGTATAIPGDLVDNTRYLVRRGKSLSLPYQLRVKSTVDGVSIKLGGFGPGDKWQLLPTIFNFCVDVTEQSATSDIVMEDMEIVGQWVGDADYIEDDVAGGIYVSAAGRITLHNCNIINTNLGIRNNSGKSIITLSNSSIYGFQNFGCLMSGSYVFYAIGSSIMRDPDSYGGGAGTLANRGGGPDHGPLRVSTPEPDGRTVFVRSEGFSNAGWSTSGRTDEHPLGAGKMPSHQPCVRANTGGTEGWTFRLQETLFEGGNAVMNFTANKNRVRVIDGLVDSAMLLGSGNNGGVTLGFGHLGVVVRNTLMIKPHVDAFEQDNGEGNFNMVGMGDSGADYDPIRDEGYLRLYNCTFIDWSSMDTRNIFKKDSLGSISDETIENNLTHAPNRPTTAVDLVGGGLATLLHAAVPTYKGLKWIDQYGIVNQGTDYTTLNTLSAVPDYFDQEGVQTPNAALVVPTAAIPVVQRRGTVVPFYDFLRNPRPRDGTASQGAVEPGAVLAV